jgi:tetratricopeptide (TPR) repeat protein
MIDLFSKNDKLDRVAASICKLILGLSLFIFYSSPEAYAAEVQSKISLKQQVESIINNNNGIRNLEKEDFIHSEQFLLKGLARDPYNPILHLNLGLNFEAQKQYDKALKEYEAALRMSEGKNEAQFLAHFNAGNAATQTENIPLALKHYQAALDLNPKSVEVKTNIELLLKSNSGKGKGQKDSKNKDQSDNQGDNPDKNKNPNDDSKDQKKKQEFKSEKLTKEDVRKILEELKSQEKKIRGAELNKKSEENSSDKDW